MLGSLLEPDTTHTISPEDCLKEPGSGTPYTQPWGCNAAGDTLRTLSSAGIRIPPLLSVSSPDTLCHNYRLLGPNDQYTASSASRELGMVGAGTGPPALS